MIRIGISSPPYLFCVVWSIICPDDIESKFANFVTKFSFRTFFHFNLLNQCLSICISRYNNVSREYFKCHRCENFTVYKNILIFINTLFIVSTIFSTNLDLIKKNKIKSSKNIYTNWKTKTKILFHSKYYNIFSRLEINFSSFRSNFHLSFIPRHSEHLIRFLHDIQWTKIERFPFYYTKSVKY